MTDFKQLSETFYHNSNQSSSDHHLSTGAKRILSMRMEDTDTANQLSPSSDDCFDQLAAMGEGEYKLFTHVHSAVSCIGNNNHSYTDDDFLWD